MPSIYFKYEKIGNKTSSCESALALTITQLAPGDDDMLYRSWVGVQRRPKPRYTKADVVGQAKGKESMWMGEDLNQIMEANVLGVTNLVHHWNGIRS